MCAEGMQTLVLLPIGRQGACERLRKAYLRQRGKVFLSIIAVIDRGAYKPQEPF